VSTPATGNLLLNVGPTATGLIPHAQAARLLGVGWWLRVNGEAIYATRPWTRAAGSTTDGTAVRFTRRGDAVYAIVLGSPASTEVVLEEVALPAPATVSLLGAATTLPWQGRDDGTMIRVPRDVPCGPAFTLRLSGAHDLHAR